MSYHSNPLNSYQAPPKKLQIALVNAILNNKTYLLEVSYWITISELKSKIEKAFGIPVAKQRLFFQAQELSHNNFSMISFGGKKRIKIILRTTPSLENTLGLVKKYETLPKEDSLDSLLFSVQEGFNLGLIPKLTFDGTSGSYFLQNKFRKNVAIFKPFDEEPFAPNNPKGYVNKLGSTGFRAGVVSGESAIREVAAYLLDEDGFSGVPPTTFVECVHPYFSKRDMKEVEISNTESDAVVPIQNFMQFGGNKKFIIKHGSLQRFVEGAEEASDYGAKVFPDDQVRKIALLDIRILNCDRNEGNILVRKEKGMLNLIPIDHGLSFPDSFQACTYDVVWMEWPQTKKKWMPLELDYISKIDPKADVEKLSKHFKFRDICLRNFRIAETVLKKGATAGLTLFEIGTLLYRDDPDFSSPIEEIIRKTEELCHTIKTSVPRGVLQILNKPNSLLKKKGLLCNKSFEEEEKENDGKKPIKSKAPMSRGRAFSESINTLSSETNSHPQYLFQGGVFDQPNPSNELFVIPEVTQVSHKTSSSRTGMGHKTSFVSREGSHCGESDQTSSDDEEDAQNNSFTRPERTMRRSSSIPASMTRLSTNEDSTNDNMDENGDYKEKSIFYSSNRTVKGLNRLQKKKENGQLHTDELFFKYFSGFLDQKIEIMMKNKQAPPTRSRFYSDM